MSMVAMNFRYSSLAGLMRSLSTQLGDQSLSRFDRRLLSDELNIMRFRIQLVKFALFFQGCAFIANSVALLLVHRGLETAASNVIAISICALIVGMVTFCCEIIYSTKALSLHVTFAGSRD